MVVHRDQKTQKNNGVYCDLCGSLHLDRFKYYSMKIDLVEVDRDAGKTGIKNIDRRYLDLDLCESCAQKLFDQVKQQIEKREKGGAWSTSTQK